MKKVFSIFLAVLALCFITSCASTSSVEGKYGEYVGEYDASMTPENSCMIFIAITGTTEIEYKQINPKFDAETVSFSLKPFIGAKMIFKPCKPGSRYMVTKTKGMVHYSFQDVSWDLEFNPNQQYFVLDVPEKPGVYFFGWNYGDFVARTIAHGKVYTVERTEEKYYKNIYGAFKNDMKKKYQGTPWLDAFEEKFNVAKKK